MKCIDNTGDELRRHGIRFVTGEADGTNIGRILVHCDEQGCGYIERFLGVTLPKADSCFTHYAECMLPAEIAEPLLVYVLLHEYDVVFTHQPPGCYRTMVVCDAAEYEAERPRLIEIVEGTHRTYTKKGDAHNGFANRHQIWGCANG